MIQFAKDKSKTIYILCTLAAVAVTGEDDASISLYVSKNGGAATAVVLTGLVTEVDATNMPGHYAIALPSSVFDTVGQVSMRFFGGAFDDYSVLGDVGSMLDYILDVRAMSHAGFKITGTAYNGDGALTAATVQLFEPGADVDVDTPRDTLTVAATYDVSGNMTEYKSEE